MFLLDGGDDKKQNEQNESVEQRIDERWRHTICHNYRLEQGQFKQWLDTLCHEEARDIRPQAKEPTYEELLQRLKELEDARSPEDKP